MYFELILSILPCLRSILSLFNECQTSLRKTDFWTELISLVQNFSIQWSQGHSSAVGTGLLASAKLNAPLFLQGWTHLRAKIRHKIWTWRCVFVSKRAHLLRLCTGRTSPRKATPCKQAVVHFKVLLQRGTLSQALESLIHYIWILNKCLR